MHAYNSRNRYVIEFTFFPGSLCRTRLVMMSIIRACCSWEEEEEEEEWQWVWFHEDTMGGWEGWTH